MWREYQRGVSSTGSPVVITFYNSFFFSWRLTAIHHSLLRNIYGLILDMPIPYCEYHVFRNQITYRVTDILVKARFHRRDCGHTSAVTAAIRLKCRKFNHGNIAPNTASSLCVCRISISYQDDLQGVTWPNQLRGPRFNLCTKIAKPNCDIKIAARYVRPKAVIKNCQQIWLSVDKYFALISFHNKCNLLPRLFHSFAAWRRAIWDRRRQGRATHGRRCAQRASTLFQRATSPRHFVSSPNAADRNDLEHNSQTPIWCLLTWRGDEIVNEPSSQLGSLLERLFPDDGSRLSKEKHRETTRCHLQ